MVLCECACANLISKANFNLINRIDLFICLHIMFQILFPNSKRQKRYGKFLDVWPEHLLSIFHLSNEKYNNNTLISKCEADPCFDCKDMTRTRLCHDVTHKAMR